MQSNHPIPQNVTQYQFRLVGDMTLKQFLELAGGLLLAYLFYASNLIFIFKYPLALGSAFLGVALAFFPIEDRPLDIWIINFFKAIYGPTRFVWKKSQAIPPLFFYEKKVVNDAAQTTTKTIKAPTIINHTTASNDLSPLEEQKINYLDRLMANQPKTNTPTPIEDRPSVEVRKLNKINNQMLPPIIPIQTKTQLPTPNQTTINKQQESLSQGQINSVVINNNTQQAVDAVTISLPATPTTPNVVSGILLDKSNKLIENAIVQIVDSQGIPKRAVRSNTLGQFMISTPLEDGQYFIEVEIDNYNFPKTNLVLNHTILQPLKIKATT